ncbi:MAG: hypothetical protein V3T49_07150 [Dehalococcoidia bacterium]
MINNKFIKTLASIGISAGIALTTVVGASAQEAPESDDELRKGFVGVVESYDGTELIIKVKRIDASSPALIVDADTEIRIPGPERIAGTLEEGARVGVLAIQNEDGTWQALQIMVKPIAPSVEAVSGAVVSREGNILTIELPNGETKEIELRSGDDAPEPGEVITAFARKAERAGGRPQVTGLERADKVRERIQGFLEDVAENRPDLPSAVADQREAMAERLSNLLERHTQRHADLLQRVVDNDRMPENARERVRTALEGARTRIQAARERIQNARERLGLPERAPGELRDRGDTDTRERPERPDRPDRLDRDPADARGTRDDASGTPSGRR